MLKHFLWCLKTVTIVVLILVLGVFGVMGLIFGITHVISGSFLLGFALLFIGILLISTGVSFYTWKLQ